MRLLFNRKNTLIVLEGTHLAQLKCLITVVVSSRVPLMKVQYCTSRFKKKKLVAPGTNYVLKDTNWNCTNCFFILRYNSVPLKGTAPVTMVCTFVRTQLYQCGVSMNHVQGCRSYTKKVNRVIFMFSFILMLLYTHLQVLPSFHQRIRLGLSNTSD